ncbi:hypothetical protein ACFQAV_08895 [Companilactobacillus huachuanensis]|uniref:DUF4825 domain-containing protein n=1 Tax=Companilactobacillus huachuanensis TaxID=2559914 RepID=A0ABW1RM75_9LACO|nr:hypothetical protein [Companilactobacillus huachuanensis]
MENKAKSKRKMILSVLIMVVFVVGKLYISYEKNRLPDGLSDTDSVLTYLGENKKSYDQISMTSAISQLSAGNSELQDQTKNSPVIFIMENKKTGRYVFKYKSHFVYLVKEITDFYDDGSYKYIYFVTGIKKDSDGKQYVKELNAKNYDDSNAKETSGYSITEYNNYYSKDFD